MKRPNNPGKIIASGVPALPCSHPADDRSKQTCCQRTPHIPLAILTSDAIVYQRKSYHHPALREQAVTCIVYDASAILGCKITKTLGE